jgi:F0F1-type ATP synthase assembly protein I
MALDDRPDAPQPTSPQVAKAKKVFTPAELALELPFTLVGATVLGGALGYFLDHRLHTHWVFTLILGGLGFAGGLREVLRRLP